MKLSKLDHVALICRSRETTKQWYLDTFEMEWIHRDLWDGNPVFLKKGDIQLALFQASSDGPPSPQTGPRIDHFAMQAETLSDYEAIKAELAVKQVAFEEEDHEIARSIYMSDPDGTTVEITVPIR